MTDYVVFTSDLHLDPTQPERGDLFAQFLHNHQNAKSIYILGDLFDRWVGDDESHPFYLDILKTLNQATKNTPIFVMHGNRDFLMGQQFTDKTGCKMIADPHTIEIFQKRLLLTHGDLLCTHDKLYQTYRQLIRMQWLQRAYLALPLPIRQKIGSLARQTSQAHNQHKLQYKMDVAEDTLNAWIRKYQPQHIIHGHTHKEQTIQHHIDGRIVHRHVLNSWDSGIHFLSWLPNQGAKSKTGAIA